MSVQVDFENNGYALIRGVFSSDEVSALRQSVIAAVARSDKEFPNNRTLTSTQHIAVGDLLSYDELREFDYVIFHERLLEVVRVILGSSVVYFGDSSMQVGVGTRGFHKDSVHRDDPAGSDWGSRYDLIRFGIYLQDHSCHSGGLKVRVGSHRIASSSSGQAVNVPSCVGDVVVWKLTTSHSGNVVRPKFFPKLCLHPWMENHLPQILRQPEEDRRVSVFGTFAAPGMHLETYLKFISSRKDFDMHYSFSSFTSAARSLAASKGVELRAPMPIFGSRVHER